MTIQTPLTPAQLHWDGDTPESTHFGDVYFSRHNGVAESTYVFLNGNYLRERWQQLPPQSIFTIGETGFGTGLNFLLAWQLWLDVAPPDARLFFISTELHPLTQEDLRRALSHWPTLATQADELLQQYPPLLPGFHWLTLAQGRVTLLLLLGDANHTLPQLSDSAHHAFHSHNPWHVDAWFLDGFSPTKNPQLWQDTLFAHIEKLSTTGTTLATFTAAGHVRRSLIDTGFSVEKIKGFGRKRDMMVAVMNEHHNTTHTNHSHTNHLHTNNKTPWLLNKTPHKKPEHVVVIGAGLAGCHIARALAERGVAVTVLEQHTQAAQEASGNPQGALYAKLSAQRAALASFNLACLQFALRHYQQPHLRSAFYPCGLLQLHDSTHSSLITLLHNTPSLAQWLDAKQASTVSGISLSRGGWWLPSSGWLDPSMVCNSLLDHPNISTRFNCAVSHLQKQHTQWTLLDTQNNTLAHSEHIVIACAHHATRFSETQWLPLRTVRGQITQISQNKTSEPLLCVICDEGYFTPAHHQQHCLGASFIPDDTDTALRESEQQHNFSLLHAISSALHDACYNTTLTGRAALRCTTPDHLPMVGALPDRDKFFAHYGKLRHNANAVIAHTGDYIEGLWLMTGFGGRGLCYIPLAAELLAAQLLHTPRPLPRDIQHALAPARFVVRELIQTHAGR